AVDAHGAAFGVDQAAQLLRDFRLERLGLAGRDNALALAAREVEIDASETQRIGAGAGPVDVAEHVAGARLGARAQVQEALVAEPAIQMDAALEAVEAVIAEDNQER